MGDYEGVLGIYINIDEVSDPFMSIIDGISSEGVSDELRREVASLKELLREGLVREFFVRLNDILSRHNMWLILLLDEFQEFPSVVRDAGYLQGWSNRRIFRFLRAICEKPESRIGLIVAGSLIGALKDAINLWNGRFLEVRLKPFNKIDAINMVKSLFEGLGVEIKDDYAEYIAMATHCHPFYIQLFCKLLWESGNLDNNGLEHAREELERFLFPMFRDKAIELANRGQAYISIINQIISGANHLRLFCESDLNVILMLEREGIIYIDNDGSIAFYDDLFRCFIGRYLTGEYARGFIPRYTSEYLVLKHLIYREKLRHVSVYYASCGPFDIRIDEGFDEYFGIGIQVKGTSENSVYLSRNELEKITGFAERFRLVPILAVVFHKFNDIRFYLIEEERRKYAMSESYTSLSRLIKELKDSRKEYS